MNMSCSSCCGSCTILSIHRRSKAPSSEFKVCKNTVELSGSPYRTCFELPYYRRRVDIFKKLTNLYMYAPDHFHSSASNTPNLENQAIPAPACALGLTVTLRMSLYEHRRPGVSKVLVYPVRGVRVRVLQVGISAKLLMRMPSVLHVRFGSFALSPTGFEFASKSLALEAACPSCA